MVKVTGGEKAIAKIEQMAKKLSKPGTLRVGFLEGATYPNGTPVAMVAAIQNFGAPKVGIPPRPFFSNMIQDKSAAWPEQLGNLLKRNDYEVAQSLNQFGAGVEGQLKEEIIDTVSPPLSPVTVMLRGMRANNPSLIVTGKTVAEARSRVKAGLTNYGASTKPLIDTSHMINSTGHEVKV